MRVELDENGLGLANFGAPAAPTTEAITDVLGAPTGHPSAGCTGKYTQVAWHDLIVQFTAGRFTGYRFVAGGSKRGLALPSRHSTIRWSRRSPPPQGSLSGAQWPRWSTLTDLLHRSGTDFWRTPGGIVFAFYSAEANPSSKSPVYEIKDNVCPAAL